MSMIRCIVGGLQSEAVESGLVDLAVGKPAEFWREVLNFMVGERRILVSLNGSHEAEKGALSRTPVRRSSHAAALQIPAPSR